MIGSGHLVGAAALVGVDEVDAGRVDLDDGFRRLGGRLGQVFVLENLGTAELMDANGLHNDARLGTADYRLCSKRCQNSRGGSSSG